MTSALKIDGLHDLSLTDITVFHELITGVKLPNSFHSLSEDEQKQWVREFVKTQFPKLRESLKDFVTGMFYAGDCGRPTDQLPDWLDLEKYQRGQAVVRRYFYGIALNNIVSTAIGFTFLDGLKNVVVTKKSSTPYTSYRRYLKTINMMVNWYYNDPFTKGTSAFKDMEYTRRMHLNVRKKMMLSSTSELKNAATIENTWSPTYNDLLKDFQESCDERSIEQCPFAAFTRDQMHNRKGMSQADMLVGQFAFTGLVILYPSEFGMTNVTDQELDDYCYVWRCLGYLLGIDDEFNFCRGTLPEIQERATDFVEHWLKPNLPHFIPEWEHMMRCMFEGMRYYMPLPSFDTLMLHCFKMLDVQTPRFEKQIPFFEWVWYKTFMFIYGVSGRFSGAAYILNKIILSMIKYGSNFSPDQHKKLLRMSTNIWKLPAQKLQS